MSNPIIMSYITVDMNQKGIAPHFLVKQLDTGRGVEITVTCDGNLVDEVFDETRISIDTLASPFYCSSIAEEPVITNLQNGKTIWNIDSDVISEAGIVPCEIRLVKDGDVVSSMIFEIWVEATVNKENATVPKNAVDFIKRSEDAAKRSEAAEQEAFYTLKEAQNAADDADHALNSIKNILGADNTYIFDGGKPSKIPSSSVSVKMIVDSELNEQSKNPVENRVVAKKARELADSVNKIEEEVSGVKEITDEISSIGDFIVETGVNKVWTYEKRNSGIIELWGKSTDLKAGYGDENGFNRIWLPFSVYDFTLHVSAISWQVDKVKVSDVSVDNNTTIEFYLLYNTSEKANITDAEAFITIKGYWKKEV